jgi:hypothetical protein
MIRCIPCPMLFMRLARSILLSYLYIAYISYQMYMVDVEAHTDEGLSGVNSG